MLLLLVPCVLVHGVLITGRSRSNERERQALQTEKERAQNAQRTHERDLSGMQLREVNLQSQLKDRTMLEKQVEEMRTEISTASQNSKVMTQVISIRLALR